MLRSNKSRTIMSTGRKVNHRVWEITSADDWKRKLLCET